MTASVKLTLVSHALCPYVQRAAIALLEKGAAFERVTIDLSDKPGWFEDISPLGKVPLLRVRRENETEAVLFESSVICEYIEETQAGPSLHPDDPLERARHRAWMEFTSAALGDIWRLETASEAEPFAAARQALAAKFIRIEAALGEGPYFSGDWFRLVDAAFAPVFRYFDLFDGLADLRVFEGAPKVRAWRQAVSARPSVKAAVGADYPDLLFAFLRRHDAHLLKLAA
ncbi:glutathione S-transferase family protein [Inquilinus sp. CAU 1745]|uniref:glutathione S-transferase family protein n=1 Tax=Inquilinus sp. CAU 1745 TaxID=3140369 RepID=UPI00325ABABF